jgi:hypothetical protein
VPLEETVAGRDPTRRPILVLEMDHRFWRDDLEVARGAVAFGRRLAASAP